MLHHIFLRGLLGAEEGGGGGTLLLARYKWESLSYPLYSPDLSPSDFDLFLTLKATMRGSRFEDLEELEATVAAQVRMYEGGCLTTGIQKLPSRWRSVIEHKGNYFEEF